MADSITSRRGPARPWLRAALLRGLGLFGFWLLLTPPLAETAPAQVIADLGVGLVTALLATWVSLALAPPWTGQVRWLALPRLIAVLLWQSLVAGLGVARRVLDPRLPLQPGYLSFATRLPPGPARSVFAALTGLVPGGVALGEDGQGRLRYHSLDRTQPVTAQLAADQALLLRLLGEAPGDD